MRNPTWEEAPGRILAKAHRENFPVASRLLPKSLRAHLRAIYGFARVVDDTGDEGEADRLQMLDTLSADVDRIFSGNPRHPLLQDLPPTISEFAIPPEPLHALIEANRRDQLVRRYGSYEDFTDYCRLSANPVGHLVLYVFQCATPERMELSDAVCTGLQLTEHIQDVAEDFARGRVYIPREDLDRFGCDERDLQTLPVAARVRELIAFEADRARRMLERGSGLVPLMPVFGRVAVAGYVAGGLAALKGMERASFDVLAGPPRRARLHFAWWWARLGVRTS